MEAYTRVKKERNETDILENEVRQLTETCTHQA